MPKQIVTIALLFCWAMSFGQAPKKLSTYLHTQYNKTIADQTLGNNPWSIGLGVQALYNNKSKFKPTIELTGDVYLEDDKLLRFNPNDSITSYLTDVPSMINLFAGASYHPTERVYLSFSGGPSFINGTVRLGIKPSFGFYFSSSQKWTGKLSYINIFKRSKETNEDFSSVSLTIGLKLF